MARIWHVHLQGEPGGVSPRIIRTTAEHPFWVVGKGWVAARELQGGDRLRSHDGQIVAVEEVIDAGYEEAVYNCRVADYHTYFVTGDGWSFDVWAHNACTITPTYDTLPFGARRINSASATLSVAQLDSGTRTNPAARAFIRAMEGRPGDDAGHIIGRLLGGEAVPANLFPQLRNINRGAFQVFERRIAEAVRANRGRNRVSVRVELRYATSTDLRPNAVVYHVSVNGSNWAPQPFRNV